MWLCLQVLYREHAAGAYSKMPFALALCCVEIPYNTVETFLFSLISYCEAPALLGGCTRGSAAPCS